MKTAIRISLILCLSLVTSLWAFDSDGDGLNDTDETLFFGTNPYAADTDEDGLSDWEEIFVYLTDPQSTDTDLDGLTDDEEINTYHTNPCRESTDGDRYDDGQEIIGTSPYGLGQYGGDMPGYVQSPGDNVFVAAYPVIEIDVDDNIEIVEIAEITFEQGGWNEETVGYSVANTVGSSISTSQTSGYSHNQWIDVSNAEEDRQQKTNYYEDISKSEEKYWKGYSEGRKLEVEVESEVNASIGITGPSVSARIYGAMKNTVESGEWGKNYTGNSKQVLEGGSELTEKIRKTSETRGSGNEQSFSTTVTRTSYNETTVTNSNSIATGKQWATATTTNPSEAGKLRFVFWLKNSGTDLASEIEGLRFNIYIGDNIPKTFPTIEDPGIILSNMFPGDRKGPFTCEVTINLEMLRDIDKGEPIKIVVADFSYGVEEQHFESAFGRDVLVEIDDGVEDGDETIDYYMTSVDFGDKYIDILKRLNQEIPVGHPLNIKNEISLELDPNDNILSILDKPVTNWSWWNIYMQEFDEEIERFTEQPAHRHSRLLLNYYQDSDHDYYTDRIEQKIGTDYLDPNSHPTPILTAAKLHEQDGNQKRIRLKFSNSGNYDAYGIEAFLYSPDDTTSISDYIIGGGGRIETGRFFIPDDTFLYSYNSAEPNEPVVLVRYNDPQGSNTFITYLSIIDPNENINIGAGSMFPTEFTIQTNSEYTYHQNNWLVVNYFNPGPEIQNAHVIAAYQDLGGNILHTIDLTETIDHGHNSLLVWWNPSQHLSIESIGETYKVLVLLTDYQNIEIAYDVIKFKITNQSVNNLKYTFADGSAENEIIFAEPNSHIVYMKIPRNTLVTNAYFQIEGESYYSSDPNSPWIEIGTVDGNREWSLPNKKLKKQNMILDELSDGSKNKILSFQENNDHTVFLKIPKNSKINSASIALSGYRSNNLYQFGYDDFEDGIIDLNLWDEPIEESELFDTDSGEAISYVDEYDGFLHIFSSAFSHGWSNTYIKSKSLPNINEIDQIRIQSWIQIGKNGPGETIYAYLKVLGNEVIRLDGYGHTGTFVEQDDSIWSIVKNLEENNVFDVYKNEAFDHSFTVTESSIETETKCTCDVPGNWGSSSQIKLYYMEIFHRLFPHNPYLHVGIIGNKEWNYSGDFSLQNVRTSDFSDSINQYLSECSADEGGYCMVPLHFHSETDGNLKISNIFITFDLPDLFLSFNRSINNANCACDGCISEDNCCMIPITVHSDSPGIIKLSNLRMIYKPTECDCVNFDGIDPVGMLDLGMLVKEYLQDSQTLLTDTNQDNVIDLKDFGRLAKQWLVNCGCD